MRASPRPLPALHRALPGAYYGWWIVAGTAALSFVAVGVGFYGQTVFLDGLVRERGFTRAAVSGASSAYFFTSALAGFAAGRLVDQYSPRVLITAGGVVMALALVWIGRVQSPGALLLAFPLMAIGFAFAGGVPANTLVARWFVTRRARAMSLSQTGVSAGGIVLVPLATGLIDARGLEYATVVLAAIVVGVAVPATLFVLRADPADHGLAPDGRPDLRVQNPLLRPELQGRRWGAREALRTPTFLLLTIAYAGIMFSQTGFLIHQLSFLRGRLDGQTAAFAISATAAASIVGRLIVGSFADRVAKRGLCVALFAVQALAIGAIGSVDGVVPLYALSILFGLTMGNIFMMSSLLVAEFFGMASFGTLSGLLTSLAQGAGALGPVCVGLLADGAGYEAAFLSLGMISLIAAAVLSRVQAPGSEA